MPDKKLGAIAQGLAEAAQAAPPGPLQTRLNQAADVLEQTALNIGLIEKMVRDGDPGVPELCHQALQQLMVRP
jgi:hypothetical protein